MVYDVTNSDSFENLKKEWLNDVENYATEDVLKLLVGNKADMSDDESCIRKRCKGIC